MTQPIPVSAISRLTLTARATRGEAPSLAACSHAERLRQLLDTLALGWNDWRGRPWSGAYSGIAARVPLLHSLRIALLDPPGALVVETAFEGAAAAHVEGLYEAYGPLLELFFCDAEGPTQAGAAGFSAWAASAAGAAPQGRPVVELSWLRPVGATAPAPASAALTLHAAADLQRLSGLYIVEAENETLLRAARCLIARLPDAGEGLRAHFADAAAWYAGEKRSSVGYPEAAPAVPAARAAARNIPVDGKRLVTEVLLDANDRYSNCGYLERMGSSFGHIFLGLDRTDPQYAAQSTAVNRAIGQIDEREAFSRALQATRGALGALHDAASFDMKELSDQVLGALCTLWFDIPDGTNVVVSGWAAPAYPATCPGMYAPPSGYIFQPEPSRLLVALGKLDGKALKHAVDSFIRDLREAGGQPAGPLARAIFAAFPGDDDMVARTLIGVMMGFLPTTQGNLVAVMQDWQGRKFESLRHEFLAHPELDIYQRALAVIKPALITAIQAAPVPPAIWRTARVDHDLGPAQIAVKAGDRLFVNIDSAMREDLGNGVADVWPVFGGNRSVDPHPTHACPGFKIGMGVMLGVFAGAMEAEPTAAPPSADGSSVVS